MSGRRLGGYWPASALKRRGWTNELMRELLPKPRTVPMDGRAVRVWDERDVRAAEADPRFAEERGSVRGPRPPAPGARNACALLDQAWGGAEEEGSASWILAGHYHRAILDRLLSAAKGRGLPPSQAGAWLNEFLALERRCEGKDLSGVLRNFLRAGGWLGSCADHPLARQVLERYPHVLCAAAEQVLAEFRAAQPEADPEAMLRMEAFPVSRLFKEGLGAVWSVWYVPQAIRTG